MHGTDTTRTIAWSVDDSLASSPIATSTLNLVPCFVKGTLILTERGEIPVENLLVGDFVITAAGEPKPIVWIGRRSYSGRLAAGNPKATPICFKPGSLADHVPRRDLWVSSEHAMFLEGLLVPAGLLVNGRSIVRAEGFDEIHYFHIELEQHDVIVAEGAFSETFVDDDSRGMFQNAGEYYARRPGAKRAGQAAFCAPRLEEGFPLEILREKLAGRAARLLQDGTAVSVEIEGDHDAADRKRIAGWAYDRQAPERRAGVVVLCNGAVIARVIADGYRADLKEAGIGDGRHAFDLLLDDRLALEWRHEIELRNADDWSLLPGSPKWIETQDSVGPTSGATASLEALGSLRGALDFVSHLKVSGWAQTTSSPDKPVILVISANEKILGRVVASRFRADLRDAGVESGGHAFDFLIPGRLSQAQAQTIRVRREGDGAEMEGSPAILPFGDGARPKLEEALAAVLDTTANPADEDEAMALLTRQTEALLARRADRSARRVERDALRMFQRRWGTAEPEAATPSGEPELRALVIDERTPCASRDAGSVAILSHMRALKALGYSVTFATFPPESEAGELARLALSEGIAICGKPHYTGVEDVLCRQAGSFNIVYLHRLSMADVYVKLARHHQPKARLIYSVADLHHLRLARQARVEQRPEVMARARATQRSEWVAAAQADLVLTHSTAEAAILSKPFAGKVRVVPFAVGQRRAPPPFADRFGVAFLGNFGHSPNPDAAYWLVTEIMPRVWAQSPSLTCKIAGFGWRADGLGTLDPRVEVVGAVESLDDLFASVRLTVAPLRFGAGVKGKVLDSFAAATPCVMSEIAAEGLPLVAPLTQLVGRDAAELAARILRLHDDESENLRLGRARAHSLASI